MKVENNVKEIYLAGGCFWGIQKYFSQLKGVIDTDVGYANGNVSNPTYYMVCNKDTNFVETVHISYDNTVISLTEIILLYFDIIDPTSKDKQGRDIGNNYRTGVYYIQNEDVNIIEQEANKLKEKYNKPIVIEIKPLENYYKAEEYHQKYLEKHPNGYCHIADEKFKNIKQYGQKYSIPDKKAIKEKLSSLQYRVTQHGATEEAFNNEYYDNYNEGIYVDIVTGEPLFLSKDKFNASCGWPSFSKPIANDIVTIKRDYTLIFPRLEVKSKFGKSHLGHVFDDGPKELGGIRYCINSASLKFIPKEKMEEEGYGEYIKYI